MFADKTERAEVSDFDGEIVEFDSSHKSNIKISSLDELIFFFRRRNSTDEQRARSVWLRVFIKDASSFSLSRLSSYFHFHRLIEENIVENKERIRFEIFDNPHSIYLFVNLDLLLGSTEFGCFSFVLRESNVLISFEPRSTVNNGNEFFSSLIQRLNNDRSKLRSMNVDFLFYSMLNSIVDHYSDSIDRLARQIDSFERFLLRNSSRSHSVGSKRTQENQCDQNFVRSMFDIKTKLLFFRNRFRPMKEFIVKIQKTQGRISSRPGDKQVSRRVYRRKKRVKRINLTGSHFINPHSCSPSNEQIEQANDEFLLNEYLFLYLNDLQDRIIQLNDRIDQYFDFISALISFQIISTDKQINHIMTFLTLLSSLFIPLNFLVSTFSMNFEEMPPLRWKFSYFLVLSFLSLLGVTMILYFKWKRFF